MILGPGALRRLALAYIGTSWHWYINDQETGVGLHCGTGVSNDQDTGDGLH